MNAAPTILPELEGRIHVDPVTGCHRWQGQHTRDGYGVIGRELAHRYVWSRRRGPIPPGHDLDHLKDDRGPCRYRDCCNEEHLEPVTRSENARRVTPHNRLKTHCQRGHAYTPETTRISVARDGYRRRHCTLCDRINNRDRVRRRRDDDGSRDDPQPAWNGGLDDDAPF